MNEILYQFLKELLSVPDTFNEMYSIYTEK